LVLHARDAADARQDETPAVVFFLPRRERSQFTESKARRDPMPHQRQS